MSSKVAVVTGSNKGIGLSIVKILCQKYDGVVYLTSRDETRGMEAVAELEKLDLHPKFHQLDTESRESIEAFRDHIKETYGGIDILINNAAIAYKGASTAPFHEQAENTLRVNFFGTYNVCQELFPLLRKHARVVHISSYAGHLSRINGQEPEASNLRKKLSSPNLTEKELSNLVNTFVDLTAADKHAESGWPNSAYVVSKVTVTALARIQQRHFDDKHPEEDIVVNAVHPGSVKTEMSSQSGDKNVDEGAQAPVWAALLPPNIEEPRGGYVWHDNSIVDWVNGPLPSNL